MSKKALIVIAAVAVMLVAATNAYGYWELWNGWFNSGHLTFVESPYFDYVEGEGILEDLTDEDVDTFFVSAVCISTFTCTEKGYTIKLWPGASGSKPTGQRGQKEVNEGATWTGFARFYYGSQILVEFDVVEGTWDTNDYYDYFNYVPDPPTYSANWYFGSSNPPGFTGGKGGSAGERIDYSP
ncbi:hypothetical protein CEE36_10970 [candidate division TA06 bacterium B3_TA06]|uniref:Uncharacterized protein n=1 Tax=candidate division TA06 bacterium B3_TA06 TaxID=2012487 RepID=A0A532USM9_UNCT6|nr:MAG: hypothetical protein CEE36_10970 [candidate division TA06 bacterium B3_TA06]